MKFFTRLFSGISNRSEQEAEEALTDYGATELLFKLKVQADMHYYDASDDERRIRSPKGLNALLNLLEKAKSDRDFDALLVYEQFPIFQNWALEFAIRDLRRNLGVNKLHGVITQRHLDIHRKALVGFYKEGDHDPATQTHVHVFDQLTDFLFNEGFQQADDIVEVMRERGVYSVPELCALLEVRDEVASPLASGAL
jgi:hypothetical protein